MNFQLIFGILVTITAVAYFINSNYLKLPKTIGLTLVTLIISIFSIYFLDKQINLTDVVTNINFKETVLDGMIAYLLFANALHINSIDLKKEFKSILSLATISVLISVFMIALLLYGLGKLFSIEIYFQYCLIFGAIISPTDPIAVMSVLKTTTQVPHKIKIRILGEALFNDAIGIIVFVLLANMYFFPDTGAHDFGIIYILLVVFSEAGGGILLGIIFGFIGVLFMRRSKSSELSILITLAIASLGYYCAQSLHASGAVAMVIAGLIIGRYCSKEKSYSPVTIQELDNFWEMVDNLLNAFFICHDWP